MKQAMEIFAGPCVLESEDLAMTIAERLLNDLESFGPTVKLTFKGSFDKANRTSVESYRGPGLDEGLRILEKVKTSFNIPVLTDYHLPSQADAVASVVDVLQVPAFLCRQTDMLVEGGKACKKHRRRIKVKRGQFVAPAQVEHIIGKLDKLVSKDNILITERGTCFGHGGLVVDMANFQIMKQFGVKTVYDATHSVQQMGGLGKTSGGRPEQILSLAKAAVAAGADSVFMETHPNPKDALSDAATQLPLQEVSKVVSTLLDIYKVVNP